MVFLNLFEASMDSLGHRLPSLLVEVPTFAAFTSESCVGGKIGIDGLDLSAHLSSVSWVSKAVGL